MPRPVIITFNEPSTLKLTPASSLTFPEECQYLLMRVAKNYTLGVHALQRACQKEDSFQHPQFTLPDGSLIYRQLTFKENIEARVKEYETLLDANGKQRSKKARLRLFNRWIDSCTAITTKARTKKCKLTLLSSELITIPRSFNDEFLPADYNATEGIELVCDKTYNHALQENEVLEHAGWRAAVEEDVPLLTTYRDIVFAELRRLYQRTSGMGFYVLKQQNQDQRRALFVSDLSDNSYANGKYGLDNYGSFLQVAQPLPRSGAPKNKENKK